MTLGSRLIFHYVLLNNQGPFFIAQVFLRKEQPCPCFPWNPGCFSSGCLPNGIWKKNITKGRYNPLYNQNNQSLVFIATSWLLSFFQGRQYLGTISYFSCGQQGGLKEGDGRLLVQGGSRADRYKWSYNFPISYKWGEITPVWPFLFGQSSFVMICWARNGCTNGYPRKFASS